MDEKATSNGNVQVWLVPTVAIADYRSPTAAEIGSGLNVTDALAWEGTTFPTATDSDDVDDRSMLDKGNATTRGAASFEATLNFFYPKDLDENVTDYGKAFSMLRVPRVPLYAITRVLQGTEGVADAAPSAGQWISVYRFLTDGWTDDISDDDSYKYAVGMLTQGEVKIYTQVQNASAITLTAASTSVNVGESTTIRAVMGGKRATQAVEWSSDNPAVATVSPNGVVTGVSAGTANIEATHPAADDATPVEITVS